MVDTKELKIVISSDTKDAEGNLDNFGKKMGGVSAFAVAAGIALEQLAVKAIDMGKAFIIDSVKAFEEDQKSVAQLNAVLKSTGQVAGVTTEAAIKLSKAMQDQTTYSHDSVLGAEDLLLTFTKIGKNIFPETTKAVLDMSTALGQDLKSSSIQLGKALQDPVLGITALRRVGVNFSDTSKEMIKQWVAHGETLKAQQFILKEIETEFGGSAAAATMTFAGKVQQLKNTWTDVQETIGKVIVNAIYPLMTAITPLLNFLVQLADGTKGWNDVVVLLNQQMAGLGTVINYLVQLFAGQFKAIMAEMQQIWRDHKQEIKLLAEIIGGALAIALGALIGTVLVVTKVFLDLLNQLLDIIKVIKDILQPAIDALTNTFKMHGVQIQSVQKISDTFWNGLEKLIGDKVKIIKDLISGLGQWIAEQLVPGLSVLNNVKGMIDTIKNFSPAKKALGGYASGMTLVGENGPELVNLPSGSYVNNNDKTQQMMGATVNIYNPSVRNDGDIDAIVRQVQLALGRQNELVRLGVQ